jgi:Flp pilus assembly protein TadG
MTISRPSGRRVWRAFLRERRAAAAVEFALWLPFLVVGVLNITDLCVYAFLRMQVENAAQVGAQAAWSVCNTPTLLPALVNCPALNAAVAGAIQGTSLNSQVTQASPPTEGFYCVTVSGALAAVGPPPPSTCAAVPGASAPNAPPGDYLQVSVTYPFTPVFPGVSVVALLTTPITRSAWIRLN